MRIVIKHLDPMSQERIAVYFYLLRTTNQRVISQVDILMDNDLSRSKGLTPQYSSADGSVANPDSSRIALVVAPSVGTEHNTPVCHGISFEHRPHHQDSKGTKCLPAAQGEPAGHSHE